MVPVVAGVVVPDGEAAVALVEAEVPFGAIPEVAGEMVETGNSGAKGHTPVVTGATNEQLQVVTRGSRQMGEVTGSPGAAVGHGAVVIAVGPGVHGGAETAAVLGIVATAGAPGRGPVKVPGQPRPLVRVAEVMAVAVAAGVEAASQSRPAEKQSGIGILEKLRQPRSRPLLLAQGCPPGQYPHC